MTLSVRGLPLGSFDTSRLPQVADCSGIRIANWINPDVDIFRAKDGHHILRAFPGQAASHGFYYLTQLFVRPIGYFAHVEFRIGLGECG
jgi:hypothetical protein